MKKKTILLIALVAMVLAMPAALAGHGHEKCTAGTQECLDMMAAGLKHKGMVGVEGDWDDATSTYKINSFLDGSNAQAAGLRAGDRLLAINGIKLSDKEAAKADKANRIPGSTATVAVLRDGQKMKFKLKLIGLSSEKIAQIVGDHMLEHAEVKMAMAD